MGTQHRWRAFAVLAVAFLMTIVDLTIVNVALPTIGTSLHFSEANLQWVVTAYGLTFGGFLLLGGRAADLLGRRRMLMLGVAVFTGASLGAALAASDDILILARGLQGMGAAIVLPAALSIVMNIFEEGAARNKALGLWGAIGSFGATIGLLAGGLLTRFVGWEYIFYLNLPIGAAVLILAPRVVPESRLVVARRRFDPLGAVAVTGGVAAARLRAVEGAGGRLGRGVHRVLSCRFGACLAVFVAAESRIDAPLLPLRILRSRTLTGANVAGLLLGGSFFAFVFIGTLFMQQVLGYSALQTGAAWLATSIASSALAGVAQLLVTRVSAGPVLIAGMALIGGGILWATRVPVDATFWSDIAGPFLVVGAGTAFSFVPISIAGLEGVARRESGLASGLLNTTQQLGGAVGVAIASTVAATRVKTLTANGEASDVALTSGFHWAFAVCGMIALLAVPTTAALIRRTPSVRSAAAEHSLTPIA